ncbi:MAG: hypothetical protein QOI96_229 [Verrucomicrobiota bacterium]
MPLRFFNTTRAHNNGHVSEANHLSIEAMIFRRRQTRTFFVRSLASLGMTPL